jgi:hypothetical protein
LWIPSIIQRAAERGTDLKVTIGGDGPDLDKLRAEFRRRGLSGRVQFLGPVPRASIPILMKGHDVFLFPSIYEGLGISLIEAMVAGCVPVASRIRGVTDFVIHDRYSGLLFPIGDKDTAAAHLLHLYLDPNARADISRSAADTAGQFDLPAFGAAYAGAITHALENDHTIGVPLAIKNWRIPGLLGPGMRRFIPTAMKDSLRTARERLCGLWTAPSREQWDAVLAEKLMKPGPTRRLDEKP